MSAIERLVTSIRQARDQVITAYAAGEIDDAQYREAVGYLNKARAALAGEVVFAG